MGCDTWCWPPYRMNSSHNRETLITRKMNTSVNSGYQENENLNCNGESKTTPFFFFWTKTENFANTEKENKNKTHAPTRSTVCVSSFSYKNIALSGPFFFFSSSNKQNRMHPAVSIRLLIFYSCKLKEMVQGVPASNPVSLQLLTLIICYNNHGEKTRGKKLNKKIATTTG